MSQLALIIAFTLFGSVASLAAGALLIMREEWTRRLSTYFVSFAAGALLGTVFLELLPEVAGTDAAASFAVMLGGIVAFFLVENILRWHHHHHGREVHTFNYMITLGDSIHNFIDGVAIAAAFLVSVPAGVATAVAVFFHEIPQEIGDFAVLLRGGWSRLKVLGYNILSAVVAIAGALLAYYYASASSALSAYLLAFTAGVFIYIAGVDMIPEIRHSHGDAHMRGLQKHAGWKYMAAYALCLVAGILVIYGVVTVFPE